METNSSKATSNLADQSVKAMICLASNDTKTQRDRILEACSIVRRIEDATMRSKVVSAQTVDFWEKCSISNFGSKFDLSYDDVTSLSINLREFLIFAFIDIGKSKDAV